jgi:hypothetical protein
MKIGVAGKSLGIKYIMKLGMKTYILLGHSRDKKDKITNKPEIKIVPKNCNYITVVTHSQEANVGHSLAFGRLIKSQDKYLLLNPLKYFTEIKQKLREMSKYDYTFDNLQIKTERKPYINSECSFLESYTRKNQEGNEYYSFLRSGLYDISKIKLGEGLFDEGIIAIENEEITFDEIEEIYQDSLFPTAEAVIQQIKDEYAQNNQPLPTDSCRVNIFIEAVAYITQNLSQDKLFALFPGNHYMPNCRSFDEVESTETNIARRIKKEFVNANSGIRDYYIRMLNYLTNRNNSPGREYLQPNDLNIFSTELIIERVKFLEHQKNLFITLGKVWGSETFLLEN